MVFGGERVVRIDESNVLNDDSSLTDPNVTDAAKSYAASRAWKDSTRSDGTARRRAMLQATPGHVEQSKRVLDADTVIRPQHLVKIFAGDNEIAEVSEEQIARVKVMHTRMEDGASFSFNYNALLFVASVLAGLGLVGNSSTTVIASMLISPIMGPVIGLAYGSTICDWKLVWRSVKVEVVSILTCVVVGAIVGLTCGPTDLSHKWPTDEMESRGDMTNFFVALPIAFFSGLGVAVSLLDDQTSSLVGVAISASLLPPAVNAGLLWVCHIFAVNDIIDDTPSNIRPLPGEDDGDFEDDATDGYSRVEYRRMGIISLQLTLANVALIWVSSMLMFRIKEVLPVRKKIFWDDLGVARKIYQRKAFLSSVEEEVDAVTPESDDEDIHGGGIDTIPE